MKLTWDFTDIELTEFLSASGAEINCPINNSSFNDKYIDKMTRFMSSLVLQSSTNDEYMTIYHIAVQIALDKLLFEMKLNNKIATSVNIQKYDIHNIISSNDLLSDLLNNNLFANYAADRIETYILNTDYDDEFISIAKKDFIKIVNDWLKYNYIYMQDKDRDERFMMGYSSYMPTMEEAHILFKYYLNLVYNDIILMLSVYEKNNISKHVVELENNYNSKLKEASTQIEQLEKELDNQKAKAKDFLPTMKRLKIEAEQGTKEQQEIFDACIIEKNREIHRLEKQLQSLKDKIDSLQIDDTTKDTIKEIIPEYTCDTTLKYEFIMVESPELENQLLSTFPNSIISNSTDSFSTDVDLVVFITQRLKHHIYYGIKSICRTNNIPYMHFSAMNIDLLKTEIAKNLFTVK